MKHILLVEDDSFISDIYSNQLKKEGYQVDIATDGQMALDKIKASEPDLLLLDINLPKMDGWQLLKVLRQDLRKNNLKVIVISNYNQKEYANEAEQFNVLQCFLKIETTLQDIVNKVRQVLS